MRVLLLLLAALSVASPARATWREARSDHFVIYSEDKPDELRRFATELERFDAAMRYLRKVPQEADSPSNRLTVFLVPDIDAVGKLLGDRKRGVAGFYSGRAGGSFAIVPRRTNNEYFVNKVVLLHEYSHHFMARHFPAAFPAWYREGFAEFSASAKFKPDGSIQLGMPANHRGWSLMELGSNPVRSLVEGDFTGRSPEIMSRLYGFSWLLTHYLTFSDKRKGQLTDYLLAINAGKTPVEAAEAAFGDLRVLQKEAQQYLDRNRFPSFVVGAAALKIGEVEVRELSAGANAIMPVHIRSHRGVDDAQAAELVIEAREIAASYPADPFVQLVLTEAELDAGNLDAAAAAADRVLAADPESVKAMVFRGNIAVRQLRNAGSTDAADWRDARRWFLRANKVEANAATALLGFYNSFVAEGVKPNDNAAAALYRAAELAPEDDGLRFAAARQYLVDGQAQQARALLAPTAYNPHGGAAAQMAAGLIGLIDKGGAPLALAALTRSAAPKSEGE